MKIVVGIPASEGIAIGKALVYERESNNEIDTLQLSSLTPNDAIKRFQEAISISISRLGKLARKTEVEIGPNEAAIFDAQILICEDDDFQQSVIEKINQGIPIDKAIWIVVDFYISKFAEMDNDYFKERALDIQDVGNQIIKALTGSNPNALMELTEKKIIVSRVLTPSDTVELPKKYVLGFLTEFGGPTSHVAIIARALNVPAVIGIPELTHQISQGDLLIIDGTNGHVIINPDTKTLGKYAVQQKKMVQNQQELQKFAKIQAKTQDGKLIKIQANIGSVDEVYRAMDHGADGIGLLRTEFLYLEKKDLPTENELFDTFKEILSAMREKAVILRTLDIGGDKDIPSLVLPKEENPFLGLRGSRFISDAQLRRIIITQVRAALRASSFGNLKIMFPMVSTLKEVLDLNTLVNECRSDLLANGYNIATSVEIGIMVEVPSIALCAEAVAPYVDFFSIGTNDLTQYVLAADRTNETIAYLYDHFHPSVFRLIQIVVNAAHKYGKWVGICGELASESLATPILLGLGIDELSMNINSIPKIKRQVTRQSMNKSKEILKTVLDLPTSKDVRKFLSQNSINDI